MFVWICVFNVLVVVDLLVDFDVVIWVVKVVGFVVLVLGFYGQLSVINGVFDLLVEVFGDSGVYVCLVVGVFELLLDVLVEVELIVEVGQWLMLKIVELLIYFVYGQLCVVIDIVLVLLVDNFGLLMLDGINIWVLCGLFSDELVVVDLGLDDDEYLVWVVVFGCIVLVLISYCYGDYISGIDKLVVLIGVLVWVVDLQFL